MSTLAATVFATAAADSLRLLANATAAFTGGPVAGTLRRRAAAAQLGDFVQAGGIERITLRCALADVQALSPAPSLGTDLMVTQADGTELDCRLLTRDDNTLRGTCTFELEVLAP